MPKKRSKPQQKSNEEPTKTNKLSLFDHVKHIRTVQSPDYYESLSEENRKSFTHFMILRALSMDNDIVGEMAFLYKYFDKIPSPQFYKLLIALVQKNFRWVPWIKSKIVHHNKKLIDLVANHYKVSRREANNYINVLVASDDGLNKLLDLCQLCGLDDSEIEALFEKNKYE